MCAVTTLPRPTFGHVPDVHHLPEDDAREAGDRDAGDSKSGKRSNTAKPGLHPHFHLACDPTRVEPPHKMRLAQGQTKGLA